MTSPFRTWNGIEPFQIFLTVQNHAIGGDQALMSASSTNGTTVARDETSTPNN